MKFVAIASIATALLAAPAFAEGDAEAGEKEFKKCKSCHMVVDGDNEIVKGGKTGPNLFGLPGRVVGSEDFRYGKDLVSVGEAGLVWDEAEFIAYSADPKEWLKEKTGDSKAKSKMSFKLKDAEDAANIWAFLVSVSPEAGS
ncbi:c-type cytochrome [Litoreibacter arenae]|uniref:Cytochrome c2 n=1 Tax=Litoreibacter arenae DSM 19593 TaxID=1123360 RepID=S9RU90_9RHOB|nr:c-type cytochrome [Litoreibacter arenae]EPX77509.1 Cytochrome c2 [Litoreibacter arenae DSM 19593]